VERVKSKGLASKNIFWLYGYMAGLTRGLRAVYDDVESWMADEDAAWDKTTLVGIAIYEEIERRGREASPQVE
jgi:hypothetical protein